MINALINPTQNRVQIPHANTGLQGAYRGEGHQSL
jgi:hypothetical protein